MFTLTVLAAVALLRDVNWTRPHIEKILNQALSRNVKLGRLSWGIALNGLNVETDKVGVMDVSGTPLFFSRHASFGIAVLPLLSGRIRLKHLDFEEPQVFLIKTGPEPHDWNFEDLLHLENTDVDLIQFKKGMVRVVPLPPAAPVDFKDVRLLLNFPRKGKNLPFFFSGTHQVDKHVSKVRLEGFIQKQSKDDHDLSFTLQSSNLNQEEISQYAAIFNPKVAKELQDPKTKANLPQATMNLKVEGKGNTAKGIRAFIDLAAPTLSVAVNNYGIKSIDTKNGKGKATFDLSEKHIKWSDLKFNFSAIELNSSGHLQNWQKSTATVQAQVQGKLKSLSTATSQDLTIRPIDKNQKIEPAGLSGQAFLTIKINGKAQNATARTEIASEDLVLKEFVEKLLVRFPILSSVGLAPQSKLSGKVTIDNANVAKLEYGELKVNGTNSKFGTGKVTAKGWIDLDQNVFDLDNGKGHFDVQASNIDLRQASNNFSANKQAAAALSKSLKLPGTKFELAGTVDSKFAVDLSGNDYHVVGSSVLNKAALSLQNKLLEVSNVTGEVHLDACKNSGTVKLSNFKGKMGTGDFQLDGNLTLTQNPVVDISFHATSFDLRHLSSLITMFKVQLPIFTERQLYGRVKDVRLRITGIASNPKIYFSAVPDDLFYQPPGLAHALETVDGSILYNEDNLILDDIDIISHNNIIAVDLYIKNLSGACILQRVRAKTDKIELADIHYYLMSTAMPAPLRKAYRDLLHTYGIVGPYGKVFGEVLYSQESKNKESIDGILGCYKAGASVSKLPLYDVAGVMAFSDDDLLFNDLQGRVKGSKFNLDGFIKEYRSKNPFWESQIEMSLVPVEILQLVPRFSQILKEQKIEIHSNGVITLKTIIKGSPKKNQAEVSLVADYDNELQISGPFGVIHQPKGKDIKVEGKVTIEPERVFIDTSNIFVGDTLMTLKAEINDPDKDKNTAPDVDIVFAIPKKAPINTLISILNPPLAKNTSGQIQGEIKAKGSLDHPLIDGRMDLMQLDLPSFDIANLSGRIEGNQEIRNSLAGNTGNANVFSLNVDGFKVKDLSVGKSKALLALEKKSAKSHLLRLSIKEGKAELAQGNVAFAGWVDTTDNAMYLKSSAKGLSAQVISEKVFGLENEITGDVKADLELKTKGTNYDEAMQNLSGSGSIVFSDGLVSRFGDLETRLTQYNLLTQGIFGFNLNNLLQSVWPVRSGQYSELSTRFNIAKKLIKIEEIKFNGTDMRLWGLGKAGLSSNKLDMEIAGRIPRVTQSMLGGHVGRISRNLTLQKALKVATFGKLQNLPALPVLGAIATDKPRTFTFNISAPLDNPRQIAKSIEKSFKWLPNLPQATAHPIPGIETAAPAAESLH